MVNIINHAYKEHPGKIEIIVRIVPQKHIEIEMKDHGPLFNPLTEERQIDHSSALEDRPIGGLGIHMIRQLMDEVRYTRNHDTNILTLIKLLDSSQKK